MIQTVTIDIINSNAMQLLNDLELLQIIRVRKESKTNDATIDWVSKYKGKMTKQPIIEIDNQLNELRNAWE
jgi:hypothetical protein